jgi:Tol biopolymer transport system component/PKD repeat protein
MVHRFHATLSPGGAISRLILALALGAFLTACHDAERSLAPRVNGPRFSLSSTAVLNGKIAFHSTRDGDFEIYVMNPDGSGVTRVTNTAGGNVDPIWSPDGKRIAFASFRSGRSEVFVINADGTGETQLTTDGGFPGAWSPDGTRIAFANSADGDDEILILHLDGSGVTRLTDNSFRDFPTAWSPNGEQILFQSDRDGDEELYVMNADGSGVTRLTNSPGRDEGDRAGWSPDGTRIVFSSDRDAGQLHVFAMQADGSGVSQLTSGNFVDDDPVWSPDGARIAFHSTRDGGDEDIFVMNVDGSGVTQLTFNDGVFDAVPVWTQAVAVSNDAFANATVISALPFSDAVDISAAGMEAGEPSSSCSGGSSSQRTVWYSFTPAVTTVVKASVNAGFSTVVGVYTGGLGGLAEITCRSPFVVRDATFLAQAGTTYHIQVDGMFGQTGVLELRLEVVPPPANDLFVDATVIPSLPFSDTRDLTAASLEAGEPSTPSCARPYGPLTSSAWYRFTPTETGSISANTFNSGFPTVVAAYTGTSVANLTEVGCGVFGNRSTFRAVANTTYYLQVGGLFGQTGSLQFGLEVTPPPVANFGFFPFDASVFDVVQFFDQSFDPGGVGFAPQAWTFGDGTTGSTGNPTHRYTADGDYTVQLTATTLDGRSAFASQTVHVRTHDVAITRFAVPQTARSGQTRRLEVSLNSKRYPETVEVQLFRSVPGGFLQFGSLTQAVPMNPKNGTTTFAFSYTFTADDATIGKVTFRAFAVISGARDALPADNEAIGPPTKVSR